MSPEEILQGVREVIAAHLEVDGPVELDTNVLADLQLDSVERTILIVELENHFEVCFDEGDEQDIETVGDVVALVARRRAPEASRA